jgi:hypothetical protein
VVGSLLPLISFFLDAKKMRIVRPSLNLMVGPGFTIWMTDIPQHEQVMQEEFALQDGCFWRAGAELARQEH